MADDGFFDSVKAYHDTIKLVPTQHLADWLSRHSEDEGTKQYEDYADELELRMNANG